MKVTQELFDNLKPGDIVLLKTQGQLLDTGWEKGEDGDWRIQDENNDGVVPDMIETLGQLQVVDDVYTRHFSYVYFTIENDYNQYHYTIDMIQEIYPLVRGIEDDYEDDYEDEISSDDYEKGYDEGFNRGVEHVLEHLSQHWKVWLDDTIPYLKR